MFKNSSVQEVRSRYLVSCFVILVAAIILLSTERIKWMYHWNQVDWNVISVDRANQSFIIYVCLWTFHVNSLCKSDFLVGEMFSVMAKDAV